MLTVTGWVNQRETNLLKARSEALRQVKAAIEAQGIEVPDTTYRVSLVQEAGAPVVAEDSKTTAPVQIATDTDVAEPNEDGLDRLASAERANEDAPNLLREDGAQE